MLESAFDFLFSQYNSYPRFEILLEIVAVFFGILSVFFSKENNILVYPTGIISTSIFVYLLYRWGLLGDMIVNIYYFIMSIYGWFIWTRKNDENVITPISKVNNQNRISLILLFLFSITTVYLVYLSFDKLIVDNNKWIPYTDIFTTAVFFAGMWLMAKRKIEHWYFWILANSISIPLYFIKGYTFTSIQYVIFLILAIQGLKQWKRLMITQEVKSH